MPDKQVQYRRAGADEGRLDQALRSADALLVASLKQAESRRRRKAALWLSMGGIAVIILAAAVYVLTAQLGMLNSGSHRGSASQSVMAPETAVDIQVAQATPQMPSTPGRGRLPRGPATPPPAARPANTPENTPPVPITPVDPAAAAALDFSEKPWTYKPESPVSSKATRNAIPLTGGSGDFFDRVEDILVAGPDAAKAIVIHVNNRPGQPQAVRLERVDLSATRPADVYSLPADTQVLAVSPGAGRIALSSSQLIAPEKRRVDIYELANQGKLKPIVSFEPHGADSIFPTQKNLRWACFIDDDHLLTFCESRDLELWKLPEATAVYKTTLPFIDPPIFSAGRKYMLIRQDAKTALFETLTGANAGALSRSTMFQGQMAFSPDGRRLMAVADGKVLTFNLENGQAVGEFYLRGASDPQWLSGDFVLMGEHFLVDLGKQAFVWQYRMPVYERARPVVQGDRVWYVETRHGDRGQTTDLLNFVKLPDATALAADQKTPAHPELALKPGSSVSIEVSLPDAAQQERVKAALTQQLAANHIQIADHQPIKLVVKTAPGQSQEITYRPFNVLSHDTTKATFTGEVLSAAFLLNDQVLWQTQAVISAPAVISPKQGESVEQVFEETRIRARSFFDHIQLPAELPMPQDLRTLGETRLGETPGARGVRGAVPGGRGR